ncbi:MAG: RNA polymerase factor sigma-54 [candidate division Zixibacteria bacterium]|nr:RNA polymerase factor sigma-54 [candidate division Zixibacteria bacterium]
MRLTQRLEQRQIISPRLQQSLRLLTLNNVELEAAIEAELEVNPLLEWEPEAFNLGEDVPSSPARLENIDWQDYFETASRGGYFTEGREEFDQLAAASGPPATLAEHLIRQLEVSELSGRDFELAACAVSALDRDGYLRLPLAALAGEVGTSEDELERVLIEIVQRLDPPGVGARDLREALSLQWRAAGDEAPALAGVIIDKRLEAFVNKSPAELARSLKVPLEELEAAVAYIKSLEPRPGRAFGGEINPVLLPDIRVDLEDGDVEITLLDDRLGRLYISPGYRDLLAADDGSDEEAARFLKYRLTAAASFIRAVHQRRRTLEKIAAAIFERQRDFLTVGEPGLKPLTMEEVADQVGFHVSTVSRAVANKTADTPTGVFPLKLFFTGKVDASEGPMSVEHVKSLLRDIIDVEDKSAPLSDEELAAALAGRGVRVARRTVAKYRKELKLPGKHDRKKRI